MESGAKITKGTTVRPTTLFFGLVVGLPTAIFLVLRDRFGLTLPPFNYDFLVTYLLTVIVARRFGRSYGVAIAVAGMAAILGIQVFLGLGFIYIDDPALIWEYLGFVSVWPWRLIAGWLAAALVVLVLIYWLVRRVAAERASVWPAVIAFALLFCVDLAGRLPQFHRFIGSNVATSSLYRIGRLARDIAEKPRFSAQPLPFSTMRTDASIAGSDGRSILSISVEAFGQANNKAFNRYILAAFLKKVAPLYHVTIGAHAAKGGTLTGELRELCQLKTAGTPTTRDSEVIAPHCLPKTLKHMGYQTIGIHGNSGMFYNRSKLYPILGFDRAIFLSEFRQPAMLCKRIAFEGACDSVTLAVATDFLSGGPRRYAHLMTLDTHFPLGVRTPNEDSCEGVPGSQDPALCLYAHEFQGVFETIAKALVSAKRPVSQIYIFGDHPPPYAVAHERNFFDREHVTYISLVRK